MVWSAAWIPTTHGHPVRSVTTSHSSALKIFSGNHCQGACIYVVTVMPHTLWWRHNERDSVSNHQPHDCSLNRLFRRRSKKTSKLRVTGLCVGNSPGTGEFPAQMASIAEKVSIWWRHHERHGVSNNRQVDFLSMSLLAIKKRTYKFDNTGYLRGESSGEQWLNCWKSHANIARWYR